MAPADKLDSTDETFPARDSRALLRSMRRLRMREVCFEKKEANQRVGKGERDGIFCNCLLEMADDLKFSLTISTPRDFLHHIILGLFGYHIIRAIIYLIG